MKKHTALIGLLCVTLGVLLSTGAAAFGGSETGSAGGAQTINIRAWIDGRSQLILDDDSAQWQHFDFAAPGRWRCPIEFPQPTVVNRTDWFPEWPDVPDCENRNCGGCFSDVYSGLDPGIPNVQQLVFIEEIDARGTVTVLEQPTAANGFRVVVEFDDNPFGGPAWYEINVSGIEDDVPGIDPSNLVVNGGFEVPVIESSNITIPAGSGELPGWVVSGSSGIDLVGPLWQPAEGMQSISLNWTSPCSISQTIMTQPEVSYILSVMMAAESPAGEANVRSMDVLWGSVEIAQLEFDPAGHTNENMGWQLHQFVVVGSGSDELRFQSTTVSPPNYGPAVDAVSVSRLDTVGLELQAANLTFAETVSDGFSFSAEYELGEDSNGMFPDLEDVQVSFGTYAETIPAGAFLCTGYDCEYVSNGPGITQATITETILAFVAEGVDLSDTKNPVHVAVAVGNDSGQVSVRLSGTLVLDDEDEHDDDEGDDDRDPSTPFQDSWPTRSGGMSDLEPR